MNPKITLQVILSPYRNDFPWIYDAGSALADKIEKFKHIESTKSFRAFLN